MRARRPRSFAMASCAPSRTWSAFSPARLGTWSSPPFADPPRLTCRVTSDDTGALSVGSCGPGDPRRASETNGACAPRRSSMAKVLKCGDLMPGCSFVAEGKDTAEVMAKGAEHAKTAHGMTSIPPDLAAKVQAAIKDK